MVKKVYAEIEKMYFVCLHLHFFDDDTHDGQKSSTNYAGSLQETIADTWREKFSNVNVAMRNVNISVEGNSKSVILCTVTRKLSRRHTHVFV